MLLIGSVVQSSWLLMMMMMMTLWMRWWRSRSNIENISDSTRRSVDWINYTPPTIWCWEAGEKLFCCACLFKLDCVRGCGASKFPSSTTPPASNFHCFCVWTRGAGNDDGEANARKTRPIKYAHKSSLWSFVFVANCDAAMSVPRFCKSNPIQSSPQP